MCEELDRFKSDAVCVLREIKRIRRSRDLSFYEDAELNREKHRSLNAVLRHLLVGHHGKPCPAGGRPIVTIARPPESEFSDLWKLATARLATIRMRRIRSI